MKWRHFEMQLEEWERKLYNVAMEKLRIRDGKRKLQRRLEGRKM